MWTFSIVLLFLGMNREVAAGASASRSLQAAGDGGSYWAIYNATTAPAVDSCLVTEGDAVADDCCLDAGELLPHSALKEGDDTCFVLGPGLIPFSGCVGDGVSGYGENCSGEGAPFVAADAAECGCSFVIEGSGCYKANDIPGQQWFVYLDGDSCKEEAMESPEEPMEDPEDSAEDPEDSTESASSGGFRQGQGSLAFAILGMIFVANAYY